MNKLINIFVLMSLMIVALNSSGQSISVEEEEGDQHLEIFAFDKAITQYKAAHEDDANNPRITRKIADAFRRSGDLESSAPWYGKTLAIDSTRQEDMLYYAEALKTQQKYDESLVWYEKYNALQPKDERAENHLVNATYYEELSEDSEMFIVKKLDFNNRKPAFGVTKYNEKLVFSATGLEGQKNNKTNPWNDLPYLDVYQSEVDENHEAVDIEPINEINSKFNDGPAFYDESSETMFVTRNNMKRGKPVKDKTGSVNLKIYTSKNVDGKWADMQELPFNSDDYSTGHPAVSKDGSMLYFASNRPGGEGGTDIYVSEKVNDTWSQPKNLGDVVNTKGNELFPYIDENDVLYFSSTGLVGLGGMDIFKINMDSIKTGTPENLGYPLNSPKDDFNIMFEETDKSGYFCSNREKGFSDDIFYFEINNVLQKLYAGRIESSIPDKSLAGNELVVRNLDTGEEISLILDENGGFEFPAIPGATYELAYQKEDVEEIIAVKTVEDVIALEYENLGIFTIEERLTVNVYDNQSEIEINDLIYKRFGEEGQFVSEQGDTLSNIEMMDYLSKNLDHNDIELNNELYQFDEDTQQYVSENGTIVEEDELEKLLISQILANPLDITDESSMAGITPRENGLGGLNLSEDNLSNLDLATLSAYEWVEKALENDQLSESERLELEALKSTDLTDISAKDWLDVYANDEKKAEELTDVERKALGIFEDLNSNTNLANVTAYEWVENALKDDSLTESERLELEALKSTDLTKISAKDWLAVYADDEEKAAELSAVERKALGLNENMNPNMNLANVTAYEWIEKALKDDSLTESERLELEALKSTELTEISAKDWLAVYADNEEKAAELSAVERKALELGVSNPMAEIKEEFIAKLEVENLNDYVLSSKEELKTVLDAKNIENIYFNFDGAGIRNDARTILDEVTAVLMANPNLSMYVNAHTDTRGSNVYNDALSEKRSKSVKTYLSKRGIDPSRLNLNWFGEDQLAKNCNDSSTDENGHQLNRRAEFALVGDLNSNSYTNTSTDTSPANEEEVIAPNEADSGESLADIGLDMIYFNFDKDNIREDAQAILKNLGKQMNSNSKSVVIHAHTDSRGNNAYNQDLSERRSESTMAYLKDLGIDTSRIEITWSGEESLATKCSDDVYCNANQHQLNRRATLSWK